MKKKARSILTAILVFLCQSALCQSLLLRPEASVGYRSIPRLHLSGIEQNYGGKILMEIKPGMRFGLKADYVRTDFKDNPAPVQERVCTGIVLEQVLFKYFNMGIGTVGNLSLSESYNHSFTLYTHLGFEYAFPNRVILLAAYQADFQFEKHFGIVNAFRIGIGYRFDFHQLQKDKEKKL